MHRDYIAYCKGRQIVQNEPAIWATFLSLLFLLYPNVSIFLTKLHCSSTLRKYYLYTYSENMLHTCLKYYDCSEASLGRLKK
jgi:hypothetical protein